MIPLLTFLHVKKPVRLALFCLTNRDYFTAGIFCIFTKKHSIYFPSVVFWVRAINKMYFFNHTFHLLYIGIRLLSTILLIVISYKRYNYFAILFIVCIFLSLPIFCAFCCRSVLYFPRFSQQHSQKLRDSSFFLPVFSAAVPCLKGTEIHDFPG